MSCDTSSSSRVMSLRLLSIRVLELLLGMTVVPLCTAHDRETVPDEQSFFLAMFVKVSSVSILLLAS